MMTNMDLLEEIAKECGLDKNVFFIRSPYVLRIWVHQPDNTNDGYYIRMRLKTKRLHVEVDVGSYDSLNVLLADPDSIKMVKEWVKLARARAWVRRQMGDIPESQEMHMAWLG